MPKYQLLSEHYSEEDKLLEAGTIVGDGTQYKWTRPPTPDMIGLDEESKDLVEAECERAGPFGLEPLNGLQMVGGEPGDITDRTGSAHSSVPSGKKPPIFVNHPGLRE